MNRDELKKSIVDNILNNGLKESQLIEEPIINITKEKYAETILDKNNNFENTIVEENTEIFENVNLLENESYLIDDYIEELKNIKEKSDKLILEIIKSKTMQKGFKIEINTLGMVNGSLRGKSDGVTYFGYYKIDDKNRQDEVDFILNINSNVNYERIKGRQYLIRYDLHKKKYVIQEFSNSLGIYMKLTKKCKISDSTVINIGQSYIYFSFSLEPYILNYKIFSSNESGEIQSLNGNKESFFYIGRDKLCKIKVEDSSVSRIHCTIIYDINEGWLLYDGKIEKDKSERKPSLKGTWVNLAEETEIENGTLLKSNPNIYLCTIQKGK